MAAYVKRTNQRGAECCTCGHWVEPGKGWFRLWFNDDKDRNEWLVSHLDESVCAANKVAAKAAQARKTAWTAKLATLRQKFADAEVPAGHNRIEGEVIYDTTNIWGGGEMFALSGGFIWYVENHGMDGDDWNRNNVLTGGAGGIGYRLPVTDDLVAEAWWIAAEAKAIKE